MVQKKYLKGLSKKDKEVKTKNIKDTQKILKEGKKKEAIELSKKRPTTKEKKQSTEFHNVVTWQKLSEITSKFVHKGDKLYIDGRLQTRSWKDNSGVQKKSTEIA